MNVVLLGFFMKKKTFSLAVTYSSLPQITHTGDMEFMARVTIQATKSEICERKSLYICYTNWKSYK